MELIKRYPQLKECAESIGKALDLIIDTYENGGKILLCGNGGSAADCEHIAGELLKGFMMKREVSDERIPNELREKLQVGLPAISLVSQSGILTAFANDVDPSMMYAQLVYAYARENDLLVALSTSGNSGNVVNAVKTAKAIGIPVISLTGEKESLMSELSDVTIRVPEHETYKVQELHLPVYHYLCAEAEKYFFG
ncbi:MAG: SIS domain-containing protein [Ruminococcaceae bacterium]|nr:SIS domain-containing protein [Oscillospiraceae bacterium]